MKLTVILTTDDGREALRHETSPENFIDASAQLVKVAHHVAPVPPLAPSEVADAYSAYTWAMDVLEGAHDATVYQLRRAIFIVAGYTDGARDGIERQEALLARARTYLPRDAE